MSDTHTNPTTIRLDADDRRLLERLAKHERLPRSEIVRRAIRRRATDAGLLKVKRQVAASA